MNMNSFKSRIYKLEQKNNPIIKHVQITYMPNDKWTITEPNKPDREFDVLQDAIDALKSSSKEVQEIRVNDYEYVLDQLSELELLEIVHTLDDDRLNNLSDDDSIRLANTPIMRKATKISDVLLQAMKDNPEIKFKRVFPIPSILELQYKRG